MTRVQSEHSALLPVPMSSSSPPPITPTGLFRSVPQETDLHAVIRTQTATMRPPGNVAYVVDNLWEWKRPPQFPSRRFAAFASPSSALAAACGPPGGAVGRIRFLGAFQLCQLQGWADSKLHPECKSLPKLLLHELGRDWVSAPLAHKQAAGQLWFPSLTADEVEGLFAHVPKLQCLRTTIEAAIRYWDSVVLVEDPAVLPTAEGEVFFTAEDGYSVSGP